MHSPISAPIAVRGTLTILSIITWDTVSSPVRGPGGSVSRPLALTGLETALRRALDNDEFREHFEPIVSVKGGQVAGFEVLLWRRSASNQRRA